MDGFFTTQETKVTERIPSAPACGRCSLSHKHKNGNGIKRSRIAIKGNGQKGIVIVLDSYTSSARESRNYLRQALLQCNIEMLRDCYLVPTTKCVCSVEKSIEGAMHCRAYVQQFIKTVNNLSMIICMGLPSINAVIGNKYAKGLDTIDLWRGYHIPLREYQVKMCPMYDVSTLLEPNKNQKAIQKIWHSDLEHSIQQIGDDLYNGFDFKTEHDCIHVLTEKQGQLWISDFLQNNDKGLIALDYETNCLKPYGDDAKIFSIGIADNPNNAVAFTCRSNQTKKQIKKLLKTKQIKKIAANMKFEELWTRVKIGTRVRGWVFDTVLAAHIQDQRRKSTSVKFQSCVKLGLYDYSSHITPFLKSVDKGGNALNQINSAPKREVLEYNAIDALVEYRLALLLSPSMGVKLWDGN